MARAWQRRSAVRVGLVRAVPSGPRRGGFGLQSAGVAASQRRYLPLEISRTLTLPIPTPRIAASPCVAAAEPRAEP